jgi:hypothetical protein
LRPQPLHPYTPTPPPHKKERNNHGKFVTVSCLTCCLSPPNSPTHPSAGHLAESDARCTVVVHHLRGLRDRRQVSQRPHMTRLFAMSLDESLLFHLPFTTPISSSSSSARNCSGLAKYSFMLRSQSLRISLSFCFCLREKSFRVSTSEPQHLSSISTSAPQSRNSSALAPILLFLLLLSLSLACSFYHVLNISLPLSRTFCHPL